MTPSESVKAMWEAFSCAQPGLAGEGVACSAWHFCDNRTDADELAELVRAGTKRATAGALWTYEAGDEPLPQPGDLSVITDWDGRAVCVIRTVSVDIVPFAAVSPEFAAIEGEGDGSLEYWREGHLASSHASSRRSEGSPRRRCPSSASASRSCMAPHPRELRP